MWKCISRSFVGILAVVTALVSSYAYCDDELVLRYPKSLDSYYKERDRYFIDVLKLAMDHSGRPYRIDLVPISAFNESRSALYLGNGHFTVHWLMTDKVLEEKLRPIRIPLYKGAIGWRVLFISPENISLFAQVNSLSQLQSFVTAQGHDWPDLGVLRANGLKTYASPSWNGMFNMLIAGRIQYFPRSIIEVEGEYESQQSLHLAIDKHLVLHYPAAYYFFTRNDNVDLANAIETGLNKSIEDGDFDKLFERYFGSQIRALHLEDRTIIELSNPFLSAQTPLDNARYWLHPKRYLNESQKGSATQD